MSNVKLNEQIAFLRKQKGLTQETLANMLGVTNQAVSKWESEQCCPDITLLPELARIFSVSIDKLMGYHAASISEDIVLDIKNYIETSPNGEDSNDVLKLAYMLHVILLSKKMNSADIEIPCWAAEHAVECAEKHIWGYSCLNEPNLSTVMRKGTVFFSDNKNLVLDEGNLRDIAIVMQTLGKLNTLKVFRGIYDATVYDESVYARVEEISQGCGLPEASVEACIVQELSEYVKEQWQDKTPSYRIRGEYMHLLPLLSVLVFS